jgi:hypothetical protein
MKNLFIPLILFSLGSISACLPPTVAGTGISSYAQSRFNTFMALPDRNNYFLALTSGYGLSFATLALGRKYLPPMGYIHVGRIKIPIKPLTTMSLGEFVGYGPLIGYICYKKSQPS